MWPFSRKQTLEQSGFFRNFTDWHSHILPGVDDGVQTMDDALRILGEYERLCIGEVWLTPHVMEDIPNTTAALLERFAVLRAAYKGPVRLRLAAENMLDNLFVERLAVNDLLPMGESADHLLVETSYFNPPMDLYDTLEQIKQKGYYVVLAHPERYLYMDEKDYRRLKGSGVKFQLNLLSLAGGYGREVQANAVHLLEKDCYDLTGSDLHHLRGLRYAAGLRGLDKRLLRRLVELSDNRI